MNEYIINLPQLQSLHKRVGAVFLWAACWLMWTYLLIPLITLCAWLMGDNSFSNEIRWFGGYRSLLELLEIYFDTLLALILMWLGWVLYHSQRKQTLISAAFQIVNDGDLCNFYQVKEVELKQCRNSSLVTVYFDAHGQILHLEADIPNQININ